MAPPDIFVGTRDGLFQLHVAAAQGFGISDEQGEHWRFENQGLHASYLRAVAVAGDTVVVTASTGSFTRNAAVYRKPLRSESPFERCQQGLPSSFPKNIDSLTASGPNVALGTSAGHVYISRDEGRRWSLAAEGLPSVQCVAFC